jgi:hypothetical protein
MVRRKPPGWGIVRLRVGPPRTAGATVTEACTRKGYAKRH